MITAKQVKELRELTGAGMLDCKKALEHTNGDLEKAIVYLREKGMASAAKKESRIAAEGLCNGLVKGNEAIVYEINSETDFVSKNEQFLELVNNVGNALLNSKVTNDEEAHNLVYKGKPLFFEFKCTGTVATDIPNIVKAINSQQRMWDNGITYLVASGTATALTLTCANEYQLFYHV